MGTATNNGGLRALSGLRLAPPQPQCERQGGDGEQKGLLQPPKLTAAQRSWSSRAQSQINAPASDCAGRGCKTVCHGDRSHMCQEMQALGDYFVINTLSTMNPKVRDWKCLPDQELAIRTLDKKRRGRELVSALGLVPCMQKRLKNKFVCILTWRNNTPSLNNKKNPDSIWKGSTPAAPSTPTNKHSPLGEPKALPHGAAAHKNGHVLPPLPDSPIHVSQSNRRFRAPRFPYFKGVPSPPTQAQLYWGKNIQSDPLKNARLVTLKTVILLRRVKE